MNVSSGSRARILGRVTRAVGCQAPRAVIWEGRGGGERAGGGQTEGPRTRARSQAHRKASVHAPPARPAAPPPRQPTRPASGQERLMHGPVNGCPPSAAVRTAPPAGAAETNTRAGTHRRSLPFSHRLQPPRQGLDLVGVRGGGHSPYGQGLQEGRGQRVLARPGAAGAVGGSSGPGRGLGRRPVALRRRLGGRGRPGLAHGGGTACLGGGTTVLARRGGGRGRAAGLQRGKRTGERERKKSGSDVSDAARADRKRRPWPL